mmetsp:Transcript_67459/g.152660  ORF Transcript_67459/g.152660 Transcript_67459/m.152660 type:complete len:270 (-) Transcript_67459:136-945(-)
MVEVAQPLPPLAPLVSAVHRAARYGETLRPGFHPLPLCQVILLPGSLERLRTLRRGLGREQLNVGLGTDFHLHDSAKLIFHLNGIWVLAAPCFGRGPFGVCFIEANHRPQSFGALGRPSSLGPALRITRLRLLEIDQKTSALRRLRVDLAAFQLLVQLTNQRPQKGRLPGTRISSVQDDYARLYIPTTNLCFPLEVVALDGLLGLLSVEIIGLLAGFDPAIHPREIIGARWRRRHPAVLPQLVRVFLSLALSHELLSLRDDGFEVEHRA